MKVGDYVRTKNGTIVKIKDEDYLYIFETEYRERYKVAKSSPNIIDLIEVGDYVNRHRITNVFEDMLCTEDDQITINKDNIKSIVTKEQFESMQYEVN